MSPEEATNTSFWSFIRAVFSNWLALMSGGIVTVALTIFERLSGKNVPLWVYGLTIIFFLFLASYLAWRDARNEVAERDVLLKADDKDTRKREYIIERLKGFIQEGLEHQSWGGLRHSKIENWGKLSVMGNYNPRVEKFLGDYLDESYVKRFQEKRREALEEIVKEFLD